MRSGSTSSKDELQAFASKVATHAKSLFNDVPIICQLSTYHHGQDENLACDLFSQDHSLYFDVTILTGCTLNLEYLNSPQVNDMSEALYLANLIINEIEPSQIRTEDIPLFQNFKGVKI